MTETREILSTHTSPMLLQEYFDNELSRVQCSGVEHHLSVCRVCRNEADRQILLISSIESVLAGNITLPANFAQTIIENADGRERNFLIRDEKSFMIFVGVAALLLLALLYLLGNAVLLQIVVRSAMVLQPH